MAHTARNNVWVCQLLKTHEHTTVFAEAMTDGTATVQRQLLLTASHQLYCNNSNLNQNASSSATLSRHSFNTHNLTEGSCNERPAGGFSQPFHRVCFSSSPGYSNKRHFEALQVTAARMTSQFCIEIDRRC